MLANLLLAAAFQIGPFYQQGPDAVAVRPLFAHDGEVNDVLWPVFTAHRDWWRFCLLMHFQSYPDDEYQFGLWPIWFNGREDGTSYCGLFPLGGYHPHIALLYDFKFALWPLWMQYKMPRPGEKKWMTTNAILFPFVSWRDDGSWGFWPLYGINHQRESDHRYALWPIVTWASYREDRDTGGEGTSWMVWPLYGRVRRAYERQDSFLPPLFSVATAWNKRNRDKDLNSFPESFRLRCPWPFFEYETVRDVKDRVSVWPFYERQVNYEYKTGERSSSVTRFGWKLVELYDDETRVFPFWTSRPDGSYFRLWPLWESSADRYGTVRSRFLSLFPIRWVSAVDRNWAKFWTLYEREENPVCSYHSLFWGIIRWRTVK